MKEGEGKKSACILHSKCCLFPLEFYCQWLKELERINSKPGTVCFRFHRDFINNKYHQILLVILLQIVQEKPLKPPQKAGEV